MNVMNRKFTLREIILLIVLIAVIFIGIYFLLIYYPVQNEIDDIQQKKEQLLKDSEEADRNLIIYNSMYNALEEIEKIPDDERTKMYKDTVEETEFIQKELSKIFDVALPSKRFGESVTNDNIVQWRIQITGLTIPTSDPETAYLKFKKMLIALKNLGRRMLINDFSLTPGDGNIETDEIKASITITFYELA